MFHNSIASVETRVVCYNDMSVSYWRVGQKAMADSRKRKLYRVGFLGDFVTAFEKGIYTDIIVKPGGDGPGIPAHRAILVTYLNLMNNLSMDDYFTIDFVRLRV